MRNQDTAPFYERPCAMAGLTSYRIRGRFGWVMIGAKDVADAMSEAARSFDLPDRAKLQVWDGRAYTNA